MEARNQETRHAQTESIRNHADNGEHERRTVIWIDFTLRTVLWNKFEFRALSTKSLPSLFLASTFALHFAGYGVYDAKGANGGKGVEVEAALRSRRWSCRGSWPKTTCAAMLPRNEPRSITTQRRRMRRRASV